MKNHYKKTNLGNFGFTLIEVLAAIILIGLIMVIVVPKINKTINNSKKNTYELSAKRLVEGLNNYAIERKAALVSFSGCYYDFQYNETNCDDFNFSGKKPTGGRINVDTDGNVNGYLFFDYKEDMYVISNNQLGVNVPIKLEIGSLPNRIRYNVGEELELDGLVINGIYPDGNKVEIKDYEVSGFDSYTTGVKTINVRYDWLAISFDVNVANMTYLYNDGNYTELISEFKTPMGSRTGAWTNYTALFMSDHIQLEQKKNSSNWWMSSAYSRNQIDFSKYQKLGILYENEEKIDYTLSVQIGTSTSFEYEEDTYTRTLDYSSGFHTSLLNLDGAGTGHLKLYVVSYNTTVNSKVKIKKIWVE